MPDDGVGLHELLSALKHSQIVISQNDLHIIGTEQEKPSVICPISLCCEDFDT